MRKNFNHRSWCIRILWIPLHNDYLASLQKKFQEISLQIIQIKNIKQHLLIVYLFLSCAENRHFVSPFLLIWNTHINANKISYFSLEQKYWEGNWRNELHCKNNGLKWIKTLLSLFLFLFLFLFLNKHE